VIPGILTVASNGGVLSPSRITTGAVGDVRAPITEGSSTRDTYRNAPRNVKTNFADSIETSTSPGS